MYVYQGCINAHTKHISTQKLGYQVIILFKKSCACAAWPSIQVFFSFIIFFGGKLSYLTMDVCMYL